MANKASCSAVFSLNHAAGVARSFSLQRLQYLCRGPLGRSNVYMVPAASSTCSSYLVRIQLSRSKKMPMAERSTPSEKRTSQGSARWTLSTLWRPISGSMLPSSNRSSTQEGILPHLSLAIPSVSNRIESTSPEANIENGTSALLPATRQSRMKSHVDALNGSSSDDDCILKSVKEENTEEKCSPPQVHYRGWDEQSSQSVRSCEISSLRRMAANRISSRATERQPEHRDTRYLAELPALPPQLPFITSSRATVIDDSRIARPKTRDSCPPAVPEKEFYPSTFVEDRSSRGSTLVLWNGPRDPENAINWPTTRKWAMTLALAFITFCVALASSIFSPAAAIAAAEYGLSEDVMILSTALFMVGAAIASPVWSSLIEWSGRKLPLFVGLVGFAVFQVPVAVAQNAVTIFICRFLAGAFGCSPLLVALGTLTDIWTSLDRGLGLSIVSAALLIGATAGPLVGAPIADSSVLGWRWTSWLVLILCFPFGLACTLICRESSASILLVRRAKDLRRATQDWALHAPKEEESNDFKILFARHLSVPVYMFASDSIVFLTAFYTSFTYGVLYLLLEIYPLSFVDGRHWAFRLSGLPSVAIIVGVCIGCVINLLFTRYRFARLLKKYGRLCPEERLVPMVLGSAVLPCGLFLMAWTSFPWIVPLPEIAAGVLIGIGLLLVFLQGNTYLLDVYSTQASSVIAINIALRSLFAAGFSVFAKYMYQHLQTHWTLMIFGVIAVVCMLIPIAFHRFGVKLRAMSKWTPKLSSISGSASVEGFPGRRA